jgi:hypothetical protein
MSAPTRGTAIAGGGVKEDINQKSGLALTLSTPKERGSTFCF